MISTTFRIKEKTSLECLKALVIISTDEIIKELLKYTFISPFACKAALIHFDHFLPAYCESYLINKHDIEPENIKIQDTKKENNYYISTLLINQKETLKVKCFPSWRAESLFDAASDNIVTCDFIMEII